MIPKTLHYVWLGGKEEPPLVKMCVESWKKNCPDFEIVKWDEKTAQFTADYYRQAIKHGNWAMASDYLRFKVLYLHGGVYLDTDMLLFKNISPFLQSRCFFSTERAEIVSCGIIGAEKENKFIKEILDIYEVSQYFISKKLIVTQLVTDTLKSKGLQIDHFSDSDFMDILLLKSRHFFSFTHEAARKKADYRSSLTGEEFGVHLWNESWFDEYELFRLGRKKKALRMVLKKLIRNPFRPLNYYKDILWFMRQKNNAG